MRYPIFTLTFLLTFSLGMAQDQLSMRDAILLAVENNYQLEIARKDLQIAQNENDWSIAGRPPVIDLNISNSNSYSNTDNPASVLIRSDVFSTGITPSVGLNWVLYDGSRVRLSKQQLEQLESLSEGNVRLAVENTVERVMLAYYEVLVQQENLEVVGEVLDLSRDRIRYENLKQEYGQSSTFDILQTRDAYYNDSTRYLVQVTSYENALRRLNLALGVDELERRFVLTDTLQVEGVDVSLDSLRQLMTRNNVTLQNLGINRELAATNTDLQRSSLFPTISLNAGASYNIGISDGTQTFNFGGNESVQPVPSIAQKSLNGNLGISLSYRISDFGARRRRIQTAELQEIQAELDQKDFKRSLQNALANTYATYNNRREVVRVTAAQLDNARQNLEIAQERFRGGLINSFNFRDVQLNYINASQARLTAIFNLKTTETELMRLTGLLVQLGEN